MQRIEIKLKASDIGKCLDPELHPQLGIHFTYPAVYSSVIAFTFLCVKLDQPQVEFLTMFRIFWACAQFSVLFGVLTLQRNFLPDFLSQAFPVSACFS